MLPRCLQIFSIISVLILLVRADFNSTSTGMIQPTPTRPRGKSAKESPLDVTARNVGSKLSNVLEGILLKRRVTPKGREITSGLSGLLGRSTMARSILTLMGPFMLGAMLTAPLIAPSALLALGALGPLGGNGNLGVFRRKRAIGQSFSSQLEQQISIQMHKILTELDDFLEVTPKKKNASHN